MKNKKGFTLLELLVVVVIIGILAAIALPQYQLARDKAEFAKYQSMVTSLRDAYDEYVLIHGVGTKNFNDLSFTMPGDFTTSKTGSSYNCVSNSEMFCCMSALGEHNSALIDCGKNDLSVIYEQTFGVHTTNSDARYSLCLAEVNNTRANRLCSALSSTTNPGTTNTWTPSGHNNNYNNYYLK